jgi:TonB family protein
MMEQPGSTKDINKGVALLKRATAEWQGASSKAPEYVDALDYLAVSLMVQLRENAADQDEPKLADFGEWIKRAGPYTKRALEICEADPATVPERLALALELEAQLEGQQGAGAALWARAAKIRAERVAALNTPELALGPIVNAKEANTVGPSYTFEPYPAYTRIAQLAQYTGVVLLKVIVGVDGKVHNMELARGLGFGLDEQAAKTALAARFKSGTKNGQPISTAVDLEIKFQLKL